jgi:V8-like Glu-specific endopeptidase
MTSWDDESSPEILRRLLAENNVGEARELVQAFVEDVEGSGRKVSVDIAFDVLQIMRDGTLFEDLIKVSDCLSKSGQNAPRVRRQLCQGLIESRKITLAIEKLLDLKKELEKKIAGFGADPTPTGALERDALKKELVETSGLLGRSFKQLYVDARPVVAEPRTSDFERAVNYYKTAYLEDTSRFWHGGNLVALLTHQERIKEQNPLAVSTEAAQIAAGIIQTLKDLPRKDFWSHATEAEAHLASGKPKEAERALLAMVKDDAVTPFAVRSTLRQMRELYELRDERPPGNRLLPILVAKLASFGGETATVRPTPELLRTLEHVFGETGYQPLKWLRQALDCARGVARIGRSKYEGTGTGFRIDGAWIGETWANKRLLLTNAHVCTNLPELVGKHPYYALAAGEAVVAFFEAGQAEPMVAKVVRIIESSPPDELDYSLLELDVVPDSPLPELTPEPLNLPNKRVNILGHPLGRELSVSLQDNEVRNLEGRHIHYITPTKPGSSGSPVFDQNWKLVALHHAGLVARKVNEGILMSAILSDLRPKLAGRS